MYQCLAADYFESTRGYLDTILFQIIINIHFSVYRVSFMEKIIFTNITNNIKHN